MYFLLLMIAASIWSFFGFLASLTITVQENLMFAKWLYIGVSTAPVFYMLFVLEYTHTLPKLKPLHYVLLFFIPFLVIVAAFTNHSHHLLWESTIIFKSKLSGLTGYSTPGPVYWLIIAYSYVVILYALLILIKASRKFQRQYTKQVMIVFFSIIIPLAANVMYSLDQGIFKGVDLTPVTFSLAGFLFMNGMKSQGLFRVKPVARDFLFESMNDGVLFMDVEDQIIDFNMAASRILKVRSTSKNMSGFKNIFRNYPELRNICKADSEESSEFLLSKESQQYYDVRVHKLIDQWQNTIGKVILLHDITDHKKYQNIISRQNEELTRMNRQKDKMISIISHDLRSPFSSIIGLSELMKENYTDYSDEERITFLEQLISRSKITYDLLENLLHWSKSHVSEFENKSDDLNMEDQITGIVQIYSSMARDKGIHIKISKDTGPQPWIRTNAQLFSVVMRNLVTNAIKFTPAGGLIIIKYSYLQDHCMVSVADTGIGISAESQAKLFNPEDTFYTLGTNGEIGSGLGLILCKEFIAKMEGKIQIDSIPGKGTNISFTLPYRTLQQTNLEKSVLADCAT